MTENLSLDSEKLSIGRIQEITSNVNNIINDNIITLPFFDNTNLIKNAGSLKRTLLEEGIKYNNGDQDHELSAAAYIIEENNIYVSRRYFSASLFCHEMIHMLSADRDRGIIGYAEDNSLRAFNEAATQWLVCKTFNGGINGNNDYKEITKVFNDLVDKYGEEKMYGGFFQADYNKFISAFSEDEIVDIQASINLMNAHNKDQQELIENIANKN